MLIHRLVKTIAAPISTLRQTLTFLLNWYFPNILFQADQNGLPVLTCLSNCSCFKMIAKFIIEYSLTNSTQSLIAPWLHGWSISSRPRNGTPWVPQYLLLSTSLIFKICTFQLLGSASQLQIGCPASIIVFCETKFYFSVSCFCFVTCSMVHLGR